MLPQTRAALALANKGRKPSEGQIVKYIRSRGAKIECVNTGVKYESMREAARDYCISHAVINRVCKTGKPVKSGIAKGLIFKRIIVF